MLYLPFFYFVRETRVNSQDGVRRIYALSWSGRDKQGSRLEQVCHQQEQKEAKAIPKAH
jgi:hypothetical protein